MAIQREEILGALGRLRRGLLVMILVVIGWGILLYPFSKTLLHYLQINLQENLVAFGIPETFLAFLKLTLYGSLFLSVPVIFYQILKSFSPLFHSKGLKSPLSILLVALFLFYLGASFCYFITLPFGIRFLLGYQSAHLKPMISVGKYVSFCAGFIFAFGLIFELPLILALLSYLRIVKASFLTRNRRYAILLIAMLSAVLTPTPDIFNMALMGGPLYLLFEIGVLLARMIERKRQEAEESSREV
ncbi:MAG: twin-arginine translocase subunit TatC [Thermodesulfobacteriota bacterium]